MDTLEQAIMTIKSGNRNEGQRLLAQFLKTNPQNELAWLWMSQVAGNDLERLYCLERVLEINPTNDAARSGIDVLQHRQIESEEIDTQQANFSPKPTESPPSRQPIQDPISPPATSPLTTNPISAQTNIGEMEHLKKCPYCAELIKTEAVICRYCGTDLKTGGKHNRSDYVQTQKEIHYLVDKKNPNTAGCLNLLIAGLGYVYVDNWPRAVLTFLVAAVLGSALIGLMTFDGGTCSGPLLLVMLVVLFFEGRRAAIRYNEKISQAMDK